ncbi:5714_t:CDS:2 [Ambispora gerdemannii]|uniref:5714_t:CDS:1 n=1 Tax=Ambispora gerdemannii TaxID=144530 RepID=A0A9N9ABK9_9GLOM|nr:5714_t:CDS:2 [Ambispora gerdemannii]
MTPIRFNPYHYNTTTTATTTTRCKLLHPTTSKRSHSLTSPSSQHLSPLKYNHLCHNPEPADCRLIIADINAKDCKDNDGLFHKKEFQQVFYAHKSNLIKKIPCFRRYFEKLDQTQSTTNLNCENNEKHQWQEIVVKIVQPELARFDEMLHWIETGDSKRWIVQGITVENYHIVVQNINLLELGWEAESICVGFRNAYHDWLAIRRRAEMAQHNLRKIEEIKKPMRLL